MQHTEDHNGALSDQRKGVFVQVAKPVAVSHLKPWPIPSSAREHLKEAHHQEEYEGSLERRSRCHELFLQQRL